MSKQKVYQQFIYKIHSTRILKSPDRNLQITLAEARDNNEIISLADSNVLRMIDDINGCDRTQINEKIKEIRSLIQYYKKQSKAKGNIRSCTQEIRKLYRQLDDIQHKTDYVAIIMDNPKDMDILNQGFKINGIEYHRLIGTTNGVKKNTVVYAAILNGNKKSIYEDLMVRMNNGRDLNKEIVPAKFEAYKALTCSASIPVSEPKGILVVDDLVVTCKEKVIKLDDSDSNSDEPNMIENDELDDIEIIDSDGYGLITPDLSKRWANDIQEDYLPSGYCVRNSFCKGMVFTFDFQKFAETYGTYVNGECIVCDVWGKEHNIQDIDLILTTSMLKLWDSYSSLESYLDNCSKNGYTFSVTKACPETLENERNMNYQFLQSYEFTDEEIHQLISPTVNEIKDVLGGNIDKTILFMKGAVADENFSLNEADYVTQALMINPKMINDPFVINRINYLIKKKIDDAKIGVIKVHGNYAAISGDPFALCQHIFKCNVENDEYGLLAAGEIYSKYWVDDGAEQIVCFRAPMSCHNNIRIMNVVNDREKAYWYQYMTTVNILNCHDTVTAAENGSDKDGDCFITTDNPILIKNTRPTKTIMCVQKNAVKSVITEENLVQANKNGFGEDIGKITNRITSMFDVKAQYSRDSDEYRILEYRIMCGQLQQQNSIDRVKGIISKPMPKTWYDKNSVCIKDDDTEEEANKKRLYQSILANKKPYFMCYIYPREMKNYKAYIKNTNDKCYMQFGMTLENLELLCEDHKNDNEYLEEKKFLGWYKNNLPVGLHNCTMNRICWAVENEFRGYVTSIKENTDFDYTILKNGVEYNKSYISKLKKVYKEYMQEMSQYIVMAEKFYYDIDEVNIQKEIILNKYKVMCDEICGNAVTQCDILLDLCYQSEKSKKFVWSLCGDVIIQNLLNDNNKLVTYYVVDEDGEVEFGGIRYSKKVKEVNI